MTAPPRGQNEHRGMTCSRCAQLQLASVSKASSTTERSKNSMCSYAAQTMLKGGSLLCQLEMILFLSSLCILPVVTKDEYRLDFNLAIKTIGLHRNLIKYIYGTPSHGLALHREILRFSHFPPVAALSVGKCANSANFTRSVQERTEQQCAIQSIQTLSLPFERSCKIYPEKSVVNNQYR